MPRIQFENYPVATVACFDPTSGELPRRQLDVEANSRFLEKLSAHDVPAVLIGASTGQGHLRSPEELDSWFRSTSDVDLGNTIKIALLRPEDGEAWNERHAQALVESGFDIAFVRPGTGLQPGTPDSEIAASMEGCCRAIGEAGLALGVYSIPDVSGVPLGPDAVAELRERWSEQLVAVKVTEPDYHRSTRRFLGDERMTGLKIVQGWDPFLAQALNDAPDRCGVTSGPMSFALFQYLHILASAQAQDWKEVERAQGAVTSLFESMQDDPNRFADLQRAKYVMGLGHPLLGEIQPPQVERIFAALEGLDRDEDRMRMASSLNLMEQGPFASRLAACQERSNPK